MREEKSKNAKHKTRNILLHHLPSTVLSHAPRPTKFGVRTGPPCHARYMRGVVGLRGVPTDGPPEANTLFLEPNNTTHNNHNHPRTLNRPAPRAPSGGGADDVSFVQRAEVTPDVPEGAAQHVALFKNVLVAADGGESARLHVYDVRDWGVKQVIRVGEVPEANTGLGGAAPASVGHRGCGAKLRRTLPMHTRIKWSAARRLVMAQILVNTCSAPR